MDENCGVEERDWDDEDGGESSAFFFYAGLGAGMMFGLVIFSPAGWHVFWLMPTFLKIMVV